MSPKAVAGARRRRRRSAPSSLADFVAEAREAARGLADGAGGGRRPDDRRPAAALERGDILIDGGNSYYVDDIRRAKELAPKGIHYVDVGTSGGVWGLERGYCMMIGGETGGREAPRSDLRARWRPGIGDIARTPGREQAGGTAEQGYLHCGPNGAGHFVKMVHNGIEYGLMAAYAEGLGILRAANVGKQHARGRRRDDAAARSRALPVRPQPAPTSPRSGGAAA